MKDKKIPEEIHMGELAKDVCEHFGGKGGGSHYHGAGSIPGVEFICDTCERKLGKGDWFCVCNEDGELWCKECWDKNELK